MTTKQFRGFDSPNYTPIPDQFFDDLMADLSASETKVLLYVMRRTFGFRRDSDIISIGQMVDGIRTEDGRALDHGTGLSRRAVINGVNLLVERGVLIATRRVSAETGSQPSSFRLRFVHDPGAEDAPPGARNDTTRVHEMHPQETDGQTVLTKEEIKRARPRTLDELIAATEASERIDNELRRRKRAGFDRKH